MTDELFHGETLSTDYGHFPIMLDTVALRLDQVLYVKFHDAGLDTISAFVYWTQPDRARLELTSDDAHQLYMLLCPDPDEED